MLASAGLRVTAIDVPRNADSISYGLYLVGDGKGWLDSVSVEVVE
jgi:hypothetical protein